MARTGSYLALIKLMSSMLLIVLVAGVLTVLPAGASELPAAERSAADEELVGMSDARVRVDMKQTESQHMWVWSKGQQAYYLSGGTDTGYSKLVAKDLRTGEGLGETDLPRPAYRPSEYKGFGGGLPNAMAIDQDGGRLFLATAPASQAERAQKCPMPLGMPSNPLFQCVAGLSVIDAETLEVTGHIDVPTLKLDSTAKVPHLLALEFTPPIDGQGAKLHLLLQDYATASNYANTLTLSRYNPRNYYNLTYAVQIDAESGAQDWGVQLDGCRGNYAGRNTKEWWQVTNLPHQATIFRSTSGPPAVYAGCLSSSQTFTGSVVRVPLDEDGMAVVSAVPEPSAPESTDDPQTASPEIAEPSRPHQVDGPDYVYQMLSDPESGRIAMQVIDGRPNAMVWYIFDTSVMQFAGTIGIGGPVDLKASLSGLSRGTGRLYTFLPRDTSTARVFEGGLYVADIRHTPVSQALHYSHMAQHFPEVQTATPYYRWALEAQELEGGGTRMWLPSRLDEAPSNEFPIPRPEYVAVEDSRPLDAAPDPFDAAGRTLSLDEVEGVTSSVYDGAARGYGFRMVLVGGADAAVRAGPVDPVGNVTQCNDPSWDSGETADPFGTAAGQLDFVMSRLDGSPRPNGPQRIGPCHRAERPLPDQCGEANREVIAAFVGPREAAVVDGSGARGAAEPLVVDGTTMTDTASPASRCTATDWNGLWGTALFGQAPAQEPSASPESVRLPVQCLSSGEETSAAKGDPVTQGFSAQVSCGADEASGHAYVRSVGAEGVHVAEALSSFRIYRDPARGMVSRVESVARGLSITGLVRIDSVRGAAEAWANGRQQPVAEEDRAEGYDSDCDFERTAGTCFQRHIFGVQTPGYACGPCGDEQALVRGLNAALNPNVLVRLREPDQRLRIGAENGFNAAVQKPENERFTDLVLNNDLMQTTLPTLEIVRYAPPNRLASRGGPRGRQIYQFAGVEASSSYGIQCLLVYDAETNTCAGEAEAPGSITVSLSDPDGEPLAGGAFEVREDVDADGVLGLKDTLLPDGACVTAEDGVGTCTFENLQPGTYLVSQVAAPPGYAKSAEPWVSEVASGEQRIVAFTNVSNVSTIDMTVTDEAGAPLSGASFAAYPDPDADGKVAPEATPAATCTTDAAGVCAMQVPAGSYVLVQTGAPGGLEGIEPVAFTFASGGQVAAVTVVNYPPSQPAAPEGSASPVVDYTAPVDYSPPVESVSDFTPDERVVTDIAPAVSLPEQIGGTVVQVIRAPGDALRLLARDPKQAVAWTAALALFCLAAMAVRRRQHVQALLVET